MEKRTQQNFLAKTSIFLGLVALVLGISPLFSFGYTAAVIAILIAVGQVIIDKSAYKEGDATTITAFLIGFFALIISTQIARGWGFQCESILSCIPQLGISILKSIFGF